MLNKPFKRTSATLYNWYKNPVTKKENYQRTVLDPIKWEDNEAVNITTSGLSNANTTNLLIWCDNSASGKRYIEPKRYQELPPEEVSDYFTLTKGKDRIVKGIVEDEPTAISEITNKYDSVITIKTVDLVDFGRLHMHKWEVSGS